MTTDNSHMQTNFPLDFPKPSFKGGLSKRRWANLHLKTSYCMFVLFLCVTKSASVSKQSSCAGFDLIRTSRFIKLMQCFAGTQTAAVGFSANTLPDHMDHWNLTKPKVTAQNIWKQKHFHLGFRLKESFEMEGNPFRGFLL